MKITKFGHCCLLIEERNVRMLIDPGMFTIAEQRELNNIDAVLYTHEHPDHYHLESLKHVMANNPRAKVFCNPGVGILLSREGIPSMVIGDGQATEEKGIVIEGHGSIHAMLHSMLPSVQNTGYFISERFWYPGDAFTDPGRSPEILALPVAGPWMKLSEAIEYALAQKPKLCFPVHDGLFNNTFLSYNSINKALTAVLEPRGIQFLEMILDKEYEF